MRPFTSPVHVAQSVGCSEFINIIAGYRHIAVSPSSPADRNYSPVADGKWRNVRFYNPLGIATSANNIKIQVPMQTDPKGIGSEIHSP